ncbi:hypothetical protein ILYODFUR_011197 [Ilyodon furcidens]|uniref:Uncharacterized protein n=1 Tax=Ilyodon furcidens TaxID=33524 RepID=A0ABV0TIT0_9TELE
MQFLMLESTCSNMTEEARVPRENPRIHVGEHAKSMQKVPQPGIKPRAFWLQVALEGENTLRGGTDSQEWQQTVHRYLRVLHSRMMKRPPKNVTMEEARNAHHMRCP